MHTVYLIDDDENLKNKLNEEFKKDDNYKFKQIRTEEIDVALKDIPALIIVNEDTISEKATEVCHKIRNNDDNSITPVIVVTSEYEREHKVEILKAAATYYIKNPIGPHNPCRSNTLFYQYLLGQFSSEWSENHKQQALQNRLE